MSEMNDIFNKEISIAEATFESAIKNIMAVDEVQSMYMTEATSEETDSFFKKLIQAFKDFIKKIKDAIQKKIEDAKVKKAINKIKKEGIKELKGVKSYDEFDKLAKETNKKIINNFAKYTKKVCTTENENDILKYDIEAGKEYDDIVSTFNSKINDIRISKNIPEDISVLMGNNISQMDDECNNCLSKLRDITEKILKEKDIIDGEEDNSNEIIDKKVSVLKKIGNKTVSAFQKIGSQISKHKIAFASAIVACTAGTAYMVKSKNDVAEMTESTDELLDSMISELESL